MTNHKKEDNSRQARADLGVLDIDPQVAQQTTPARGILGTRSRAQGSTRRHKRTISSAVRS